MTCEFAPFSHDLHYAKKPSSNYYMHTCIVPKKYMFLITPSTRIGVGRASLQSTRELCVRRPHAVLSAIMRALMRQDVRGLAEAFGSHGHARSGRQEGGRQ